MQLILIRHAETIENSQQIVQGHLPGHLSENGKEQAKNLGRKLQEFGPYDRIISSDLERAKETATIISKELNSLRISFETKLRERNYGILQGQSIYQLKRLLVENKTDIKNIHIPNSESYNDFEARIVDYYNGLIEVEHAQKLIIVTHAGVLRVIAERILKSEWNGMKNCDGIRIIYTSHKEFEIDKL